MDLFVLTYRRSDPRRQHTLRRLSEAGLAVRLVVQAREQQNYDWVGNLKRVSLEVLPGNIQTVAPTRQYLSEMLGDERFVMIDDDLHFFKRRDDDRSKFRDIEDVELVGMFGEIESSLWQYAHVGIAAREGGNRNTVERIENTRIMRLLAYDRAALRQCRARFDAMDVMEDFHVALTLLRYRKRNLVLNNYCHNQAEGSDAPGGCSTFRTPKLHTANANRLAFMHPQYVTVVEKETKTAWGGGKRTDVRIQWKKAFENG